MQPGRCPFGQSGGVEDGTLIIFLIIRDTHPGSG
jgi:hypothetical protein